MNIEQLVWAVLTSTFAKTWHEAIVADGQSELAVPHHAHPPEHQPDDRKLSYATSSVPTAPKVGTED